MSQVQLVSECFIRPNCNAQDSPIKLPFHLGPLDYKMLSLFNIQSGLLFSNKPLSFNSLLDKLKESLSMALVHFYPLAGRFVTKRYEDNHSCSIYIDSGNGPGARLIHALARTVLVAHIIGVDPETSTSDQTCQIFPTIDVPLVVGSFFDLGERATNYDGHTRPLLSIQVTELGDGVFFGCSMNHCVGDGTSFEHFMSMLSEIFISLDGKNTPISLSRMPNYKRPIPDKYDPIINLPYLEPSEFIIPYKEVIQLNKKIFHFSAESMTMLKAKANSECHGYHCAGGNAGNPNISSLQALTALLWRSITRARNPPPDEKTTCALAANLRPRFDPPLSNDHFGNFITAAKATVNVGELLCHDLGWAASLLHQAVIALDDKTSCSVYLTPFTDGPLFLEPNLGSCGLNPVFIAGSPRFDKYGPEFGLGRATTARKGFVDKADGWITANTSREGGGSVDLDLCLQADTMTVLISDVELLQFAF